MGIRSVLAVLLLASLPGCSEPPPLPPGPREPTRENVISAAREIMRSARFCALTTVDAEGLPRARTLAPFAPLEDMTVWFATRPNTRKVEQIRAHPDVTLYYFDAERLEYATVLGRARLVDGREEMERWRDRITVDLYPDWPDDCLLVEVTPTRLEVLGRGLVADPETWQPPGIDLP